MRITGQLIDTATGAHLWADRFDGALEDIFELQDQVTASVVGAIAPKLEQAEIERAKRKPTENLDAYLIATCVGLQNFFASRRRLTAKHCPTFFKPLNSIETSLLRTGWRRDVIHSGKLAAG